MMRMALGNPVVTVFISSPGDVAAEREIVKRAIEEINADPAWNRRCKLIPLAYENCVPSQMGKSAQRVVDDFMRKSCEADIVVCIFCNRLGTPTLDESTGQQYLSGAHYEFESARAAFQDGDGRTPRIMLFLGSRDFPDESSDEAAAQYIAARKFKNKIKDCKEYEGLYVEYRELKQFEGLVRNQLRQHLDHIVGGTPGLADLSASSEATIGSRAALRAYLWQLSENYRWLELQGIREAGTLRIELEKVYVALKAEPESEYDRQQASNLHSVEVREAAGVDSTDMIDPRLLEEFDAENIRLTYRPSRDEAKRAQVTGVQTLGHAFREHRRIVILGGPGSGKTTLGRWLALQLAYACLRELDSGSPQRVTVPISQIDPDTVSSDGDLTDLGPSRLPIFLRLAHFARELAERERNRQPSLSLIDYLGHDPDSCSLADGLTRESRNALFLSHLEKGKSVVILDGLDELSEANRRAVVLKIQDFIEKYILPAGSVEAGEQPWTAGGNQIVVTSRYVGYKFAPVQAGCVHFGIQPMRRPAVERFAHCWTGAVNAELAAERRPGLAASQLLAEIYNEAKPKVRELATNPLLITILATVYWRDGSLPDQRAGLYDRIVENLLRIWLNREECRAHNLTREELLAALEPLAADMQENSSRNGLVSLDRIGELVEGPLAHMSGMSTTDRRFRPRCDALLATIRKHVGLLAEQSTGNYAFFHRTFQEFLAARHLLAERTSAAKKISERIEDPIWREPLLLALGFATIEWGQEERSRLLGDVLAADPFNALIPQAAMLLVAALPDLRNAPSVVVEQIAVRLLTSYSIILAQTHAPELSAQIEQTFMRLRQGLHGNTVARQVAESIRLPANERDLAGAAATILRHIDWFTIELVESLLMAAHRDRADLDWPIHRALVIALGHNPARLPWLTLAPAASVKRLLGTHLPMRKLLESTSDLVDLVRNDTEWLCLIVALYGGLADLELLEQMNRDQQEHIEAARSAAARVPVQQERETNAPRPAPWVEFSPQYIVGDLADSDLSRLIQRHLAARKPARELADAFRRKWEKGSNAAGAAEALIGLAALGEDVLPLLRAALARIEFQPTVQAAFARMGWLRAQLREPLLMTTEAALRTIPEAAPEQCQLDLLRIALTARMASGGVPVLVSTNIPEHNYVAATRPAVRAAIEAEYWSYLFSGTAGDGRHEGTSFALLSTQVTSPLDCLLHSWSIIPDAANRSALRRLPWPQAILAPQVDSPVERYLAMLEAMTGVPREYHSIAGYVLARCRPVLEKHPELVWETLAVCWSNGEEFIRGYLKYHHSRLGQIDELRSLDDQLLAWLSPEGPTNGGSRLLSRPALFQQISRIVDPYLRFRAQWRFLVSIFGEDEALEVDPLRLWAQIQDPSARIRALEWTLMTIPTASVGLVDHIGLLNPIVRNLFPISDPENWARAQCRLAFFTSEHLETLLRHAVESVGAIADPVRKAETISEIRAAWGSTAGISDALDVVAQTISEPWERDKALGRASLLVQTFRHQYHTKSLVWRLPPGTATTTNVFRRGHQAGSLPWVILYLSTMASELEALGATSASSAALWNRLLGKERNAAVAALVDTGLEGGIPVTAREALTLDRVLQIGEGADIDPLWPYLELTDLGAMGTVARWAARRDQAAQWSALVQAELGRLTPEVVSSVIDVMATSTDRLRLRAALALHGPTPNTQNPKRRWLVRRVGAETVNALARHATQTSNSPALQTALNWIHHDIHHDDTKAMEGWLSHVESNGHASPAAWILRTLESIRGDVVPLLLSALGSPSADLQRTLLLGLARLAYCSSGFRDSAKGIHKAVATVSRELRASVFVLPNGPTTLLEIAKESVEAGETGDGLQQARRLLEARRVWLDEPNLSDDGKCLGRLKAIGEQLYITVGDPGSRFHYWAKADRVAVSLAQNPRILELLLALLADSNVNADPDGYIHHLLTATEAVARFSPDRFAVLAPPELWEPILTEWAQYGEHWTGRMAAVRLLGRLRRVTTRAAHSLRAAMDDVSFVQRAAYESVCEFRRIEGDILPELLALIDDPSAAVAAATAQLLASVARADIKPVDRRRILRSLQQAATRPSMARPVYLMEESAGTMSIKYVDNLDRILYRAVFEISGM